MTIKDIMARAGLSLFGEIALVVFLVAFLFIVWRVMSPSRKQELDRMANLPLDDETKPSTRSRRA
jgi:cbb3-type cytochrome oxidase subunit 3